MRKVIHTTNNATFRYVSLQGYIRLIQEAELKPEKHYSLLEEVFDAAVELADKKGVSLLVGVKRGALRAEPKSLRILTEN